MRLSRWTLVTLLGGLLPGLASAGLSVGQPLPAFQGTDLTGTERQSSELVGRPAVVIAATSRSASGAAQAWGRALAGHTGDGMPLITLMAVDLPFFISNGMALRVARGKIPRSYWPDTWLGGEGDIQRALELEPDSDTPYVFTLDDQGNITAAVHAGVDAPEADRIWLAVRAWSP